MKVTSFTESQERVFNDLPAGTEVYAEPIKCRLGHWYTVQDTQNRDVFAREDDLDAALIAAVTRFRRRDAKPNTT